MWRFVILIKAIEKEDQKVARFAARSSLVRNAPSRSGVPAVDPKLTDVYHTHSQHVN